MILLIIMLAISVNIDSLGVGISYGLRNIKIPFSSKIILCSLSIIFASIALVLGKWLTSFLPITVTNLIGVIILVCMGLWIIFQNIFSKEIVDIKNKSDLKVKESRPFNLYIKPLQLTIQIIKDPVYGDVDNSNTIDSKEALYLGLALSLDSFVASFGSCAAGISSMLIPFLIGIFQIVFLTIGTNLGKRLSNHLRIDKKFYFLISGILLIVIGIVRLF